MTQGVQELVKAVSDDSSMALFEFLRHLPLTMITSSLAVVLVALFFVTSADSGALVIDMLTSKGEEESPVWQRIFWALLVGGIAVALLIAGGLESLQAATIASALPFTIVMILMCWGLLKAMHLDATKRSISREARLLPGTSDDWRARLRLLAHNPIRIEVVGFIRDHVLPALQEVAVELRK
ncbi:BCCT family transporter [Stenotrophomonas sp.]|nr:BCCT family transporter [Stenotrophomonas sp.]